MDPKIALEGLLDTENGQKRNVISNSTYAIVASRIGLKDQKIIAGKLSRLKKKNIDFGQPPHTIIIPGRMHFTESDALTILGECIDKPDDNSDKVEKISNQMLKKYVPMVRDAIKEIERIVQRSKGILRDLEECRIVHSRC